MRGLVQISYRWVQEGQRLEFVLSASGSAAEFLGSEAMMFVDYPRDLSSCPEGVAVIPILANLLPIAWLGEFNVEVNAVDLIFASNMAKSRSIWAERHKVKNPGSLIARKAVAHKRTPSKSRTLCLFSGGMDAAATVRRQPQTPDELIIIKGADIGLEDNHSWRTARGHAWSESRKVGGALVDLSSNFRSFFDTHKVERGLAKNWWGRVQHGMGMLGLCAPLAWVDGADRLLIASSYKNFRGDWGSSKETDELTSWEGCSCLHDAHDWGRQDKANFLASLAANLRPQLRVCWEPGGKNCGKCEKCVRTSINLALAGTNPEDFGVPFRADMASYAAILMHGKRPHWGLLEFWDEIEAKAGLELNGGMAGGILSQSELSLLASKAITRRLRANANAILRHLARLGFPAAASTSR